MLPRRAVSSCAVRRFPAAFSRATVDLARLDLRCCIAAALKGMGKIPRAALLHLLHLPSTPRCCASLDASNMAAMPTGLAPACRARAAEHSQAGCPSTGSMIRAKCCATFNLLSRGPCGWPPSPFESGRQRVYLHGVTCCTTRYTTVILRDARRVAQHPTPPCPTVRINRLSGVRVRVARRVSLACEQHQSGTSVPKSPLLAERQPP